MLHCSIYTLKKIIKFYLWWAWNSRVSTRFSVSFIEHWAERVSVSSKKYSDNPREMITDGIRTARHLISFLWITLVETLTEAFGCLFIHLIDYHLSINWTRQENFNFNFNLSKMEEVLVLISLKKTIKIM